MFHLCNFFRIAVVLDQPLRRLESPSGSQHFNHPGTWSVHCLSSNSRPRTDGDAFINSGCNRHLHDRVSNTHAIYVVCCLFSRIKNALPEVNFLLLFL